MSVQLTRRAGASGGGGGGGGGGWRSSSGIGGKNVGANRFIQSVRTAAGTPGARGVAVAAASMGLAGAGMSMGNSSSNSHMGGAPSYNPNPNRQRGTDPERAYTDALLWATASGYVLQAGGRAFGLITPVHHFISLAQLHKPPLCNRANSCNSMYATTLKSSPLRCSP